MAEKVTLKVQKIERDARLQSYAYADDAGLDVYSIEDVVIPPGQVRAIRIGLKICIPPTHFCLMKGKTGLAKNSQLHTIAEVYDPNYRGEWHAMLLNSGSKPYLVRKLQKVAQLIILGRTEVMIEEVEELDSTERGEKHFGSSGLG